MFRVNIYSLITVWRKRLNKGRKHLITASELHVSAVNSDVFILWSQLHKYISVFVCVLTTQHECSALAIKINMSKHRQKLSYSAAKWVPIGFFTEQILIKDANTAVLLLHCFFFFNSTTGGKLNALSCKSKNGYKQSPTPGTIVHMLQKQAVLKFVL